MHDPFPSVWADILAQLPRSEPLVFHPEPNTTAERLSCVICEHGAEASGPPPEWLITHRSRHSTITRGLHERCRSAHASSRYSKTRT